jgi:aspartate-semialdehyde dehydrogenase
VATTCVRVPVFNAHSIAINVDLEKPLSVEEAQALLSKTPGVRVVDAPKANVYPMPLDASGQYDVLVGRIRKDHSSENGLVLWCAGDNIWKGAAQNAIQIAEVMIARGLVKK